MLYIFGTYGMILNCIAFFCLELVLDRKFADITNQLCYCNHIQAEGGGGLITCSD